MTPTPTSMYVNVFANITESLTSCQPMFLAVCPLICEILLLYELESNRKRKSEIQTSRRPCEYQHKIHFQKLFVFYKFGAFFKKVSFAIDETVQPSKRCPSMCTFLISGANEIPYCLHLNGKRWFLLSIAELLENDQNTKRSGIKTRPESPLIPNQYIY